MKEDLLHFIWGQNKLHGRQLTSTTKEALFVRAPGILNHYAGPDFFNAQVEIEGQFWAGNVEIHIKSSDWYAHNHEEDPRYDNVILHVVWEDDVSVFRKDGSQIPTLELKNYIPRSLLERYEALLQKTNITFINCEKHFDEMDSFLVEQWYHRLYVERLEQKSRVIENHLKRTNNDWEAVLFAMLLKSFGSTLNGELFMSKAMQLDFSIVRKTRDNSTSLESLLFGYLGLLQEQNCTDSYFLQLNEEYRYLSKKFNVSIALEKPKFYGLRPSNFPTLRVSQLVHLYCNEEGLFATLMEIKDLKAIYDLFEVSTSTYWENHYTFGKVSKRSIKKVSKAFVDLLVINTLIPLRFCHDKHLGRDGSDQLIAWMEQLDSEKNSIVGGFENLGTKTKNALESQAQLQLYKNYCSKNKCLQCNLGARLLNRNI
ncbi:DUF2851 family protein [Muricauda sp. JGD-17]|uniref:DUF2851 family protein n=1 Tax=Flagellimonas ochracea TaxID=2696472 RepID=A0A964WY49_9FLAO|nr:DUF2851 family protein [Allomuricauda ochracea]NAY92542.1 DUF2851 family protein [Allomuricauda ochracea]